MTNSDIGYDELSLKEKFDLHHGILNSSMSRDFYLDNGKIVVNSSLEISDYFSQDTMSNANHFNFYIQASTIGLKTFVINFRINLFVLD